MDKFNEKLNQLHLTIDKAIAEIKHLRNEVEIYKSAVSEIRRINHNNSYDEFDDGFNVAISMVEDILDRYDIKEEKK